MKEYFHLPLLALVLSLGSTSFAQVIRDKYTQRFIDLRAKIINPANGYFSPDGVPYHSVESLLVDSPDYGHETTSQAYSYWIWLEVMNGRVTGDWTALNGAWSKMESKAIPSADQQPTAASYRSNNPAIYAPEFELPDRYPAPLTSSVLAGQDPVSDDLTASYGPNVYGMHWIFDCDNFYGFGNKGDGVGTPSYINPFRRGEQESSWETVPHPSWETFRWGSNDGTGFLRLFVSEATAPVPQWRYTNAPDADARAVQAIYWGVQFAKEQGLAPDSVLPLAKASKLGDFGRLAMFDKYFRTIGVQSRAGPGGSGYASAHYLLSGSYTWGGPIAPLGWAFRTSSSHNHFGYQNPVAAYSLSATPELRPTSAHGARDWGQSLTRQLEFYRWLQSAEGAIAGGATNSLHGRYDPYPVVLPTFYGLAYQEDPIYRDPGSNTWFGFQAWSMERVAEYYYITNDVRAKVVLDQWIAWAKTVVQFTPDGSFTIPSELSWVGAPNTWNPASPVPNTHLHVVVVSSGQDLGVAAALAKTFTYYAAATQKWGTFDSQSRDVAREILDRMWTRFFEPIGKGVAITETHNDYTRFFEQTVPLPAGWSGKMANGDPIVSGVKFIDIRSKYRTDPDYPVLAMSFINGTPFEKKYHRFWAQAEIALANAEFGRLAVFEFPRLSLTVAPVSTSVAVGSTTVLTATVTPPIASNQTVTWTSSNPSVASVNASGVVTGVSQGSAVITVRTFDGKSFATSAVLVTPPPPIRVTNVILNPPTAIMPMGTTTTLTATVIPIDATNKTVTWISSDPTIARVSATGVVTAVTTAFRGGTTTVRVTTEDGNFTATAMVVVMGRELPPFITRITPSSLIVPVGGTAALTATIDPPDANEFVLWISSNPEVARINPTGVVTGVSVGSAIIRAGLAGLGSTASAFVTVTPAQLPCIAPLPITLNFAKEGASDSCYVTSAKINFINSWNMQLVEINGVPLANRWSEVLPPRINGNYYIHYVGTFPWSHLEINGTN